MFSQKHKPSSKRQSTAHVGWLAVAMLLLVVVLQPALYSQEQPVIAIRGGTVLTMTGPPIPNGTVLIRGAKIEAVGAEVKIPKGATIVDATGKYVMPGIVDAMSYYGIRPYDLDDTSNPVTPENRAIQGFYPFGEFMRGKGGPIRSKDILDGGVTTIYIAPGDRQVIGGQGAVVKTAGKDFDSLILREPAAIDMTLGEPPKQAFRPERRSPATRMSIAGLIRKELVKAQEYDRTWSTYQAKPDEEKAKAEKPRRELGLEALVKLLHGEIPARVQADLVDDIRTAIRLAEEFGFALVLDSGVAAYKVRELLGAKKIPVVLGPTSHPFVSGGEGFDLDVYRMMDERNAALLSEAGVKIALASFARGLGNLASPITGKWLLLEAALATAYGLPDEEALKAVTINAAEILGVADRVGSLEPGKDADVIILDGPPLSVKTWVERVYVNGELVYSREAAKQGQ